LDGKNRQNGIHSTIQYRILNSPNVNDKIIFILVILLRT